uniref:hypothetical protein n=1 Tax=Eisenbergiella sp. TaxID=1924109 RepID=UPI003FEF061C
SLKERVKNDFSFFHTPFLYNLYKKPHFPFAMYAAGRTVSKTAAVQTRQLFLLSLSDILFIDNA